MKGIILLPLLGSLTACGYIGMDVSDYTIYPTAGCCNSVVVNPVVVRPCCGRVIRTVASPCCSSFVAPVDVTTVSYDYY